MPVVCHADAFLWKESERNKAMLLLLLGIVPSVDTVKCMEEVDE